MPLDALSLDESERFDAVVIYNAYPHFFEKAALVEKVYRLVKTGGRFVVAHGSGKDAINRHHEAVAAGVSCGLRAASEESALWADKFKDRGAGGYAWLLRVLRRSKVAVRLHLALKDGG